MLIEDNEGGLYNGLVNAMERWPYQHKMKGKELLVRLTRLNRFVRADAVAPDAGITCSSPSCRKAATARGHPGLHMILGLRGCPGCGSLPKVVYLDNYSVSSFADHRQGMEAIRIEDGQWDKATFVRNVWDPVFKYAKYVKLYDPQIGRTPDRSNGGFRLKPNFRRGLEWVIEEFVKWHPSRPKQLFEIVTCVRFGGEKAIRAAQTIHDWGRLQSKVHGFPFHVYVKKEWPTFKMGHDRFLFTDQIKLCVTRGFDLLRDDGKMRDVGIFLEEHPEHVDAPIRKLKDL